MLEHPEISWIERTGYPSWLQDMGDPGEDSAYEDSAYEEAREREFFGD